MSCRYKSVASVKLHVNNAEKFYLCESSVGGNALLIKGQNEMDRLVGFAKKDIVTHIIAVYICGEQKSISKHRLNKSHRL